MTFTLEPLDLDAHADLLHAWVTHPRSVYWGMQGASVDTVRKAYAEIAGDPHHEAWLGRLDGAPVFLAETYEPAHSELAEHYTVEDGDVGMHVLVAPPAPGAPARHGLTSGVMRAVMSFIFADPRAKRVVVEPDERNDAIARKNAEVGFVEERRIQLSDKVARLSFCTRDAYALTAPEPPAHLTPETMAVAHRNLIAKAIAEFSHERIVTPAPDGDGFVLEGHRFSARRYGLEHWVVDPGSLRRDDGEPLDAMAFLAGLAGTLGIPDRLVGTYLEEIAATLAGAAWKHHHERQPAAALVHADFQTIEAAMTEGHPGFVANNGRIGFGLADHEAYAPEAGRPVRLLWLAALRSESDFTAGAGVTEEDHYAAELGPETLARFAGRLRALGLDPADYRYLPVHPWQWEHKHAVTFAPDVARRAIVPLGAGPDRYRAQQSIRTFFNTDRPDRHYVKTALAIQNMGFLRGLSPAYMRATPPINDWVAGVVAADDTLRECGFGVLRELASVGYTGDAYHRSGFPSAHQRMLAALWRESPVPRLAPGERLATMASLLHRDRAGRSLVAALVQESGLPAGQWVAAYLRAYVRPVVHCILRHDLAFMPHGENVIMVLAGHVPTRVFMKDIGEEVAVMSLDRPLPPEIERIRIDVSDDVKALALHTDVLDGFLRHLAGILDGDGVLPWDRFWALVADCVDAHAADHPDLRGRLDLARPEFAHSCLNRLQLRNTLQMVDLTDQAGSLIFAGTLANPIAR
ncbi:GNAT family N-acetyltransferase [Asanoa sp. WMMD1127]|uniref:GNAT family N-acetyltransferase n=1 Tax=Asanoa sp. WMMD1127 TaxID=3016107 RepID=UPI002415A73D|nr:GNAT family N-acetyltransferase [Asanoa sp. WMMD1127]MDG4824038.1 GNAT family N-acetyltransferase [Asanoa sp. WMMD1127]